MYQGRSDRCRSFITDYSRQAISFSKFDYDLLKHRLGIRVNKIHSSLMVDRFGERLTKELIRQNDTRLLSEMIDVVEARNFQPLHRLLSLIENSVHTHVRN